MKTIIMRELFDNVKDFRFILLFIFSIFMFILNGIVFSEKYSLDVSYSNSKVYDFFSGNGLDLKIYPKPSPFQFIAEGNDKFHPKEYYLRPGGNIRSSQIEKPESRLPNIPEPDWIFIIKIIFSLYVILIGYNTISGEKEQGTLKQILSNPIGRFKIITAKYIALFITFAVPLLTGMLISLIINGILTPEIWTTSTLHILIFMICTTFIYLSIFAFLNIIVSSLIHTSSLVLLILMVIWTCFTISGDISGIIAQKIAPVPSEMDIAIKYNTIDFRNHYKDFLQRVNNEEFETKEELIYEYQQYYIDVQKKYNMLLDDFRNSINQRIKLAHNLSRYSPVSLFQFASERIAGTGISREENFLEDVKGYSIIYDKFLKDKFGNLPLEVDFVGYRFSVNFKGEKIKVQSPRSPKREFDVADIPVFQEHKPSIALTLHDALLDLSGLLLWNIVLAMGAFLAFNRADVR